MNELNKSLSTLEWLSIARRDWARLRFMLEKKDAEAAGFFLQQSLEKYLQAFLLHQGWRLRKIHELDALLDEAAKYNPDLENLRSLCERISGYYLADRYPPLVASGLTPKDIQRELTEAERFIRTMFPEEEFSGEE